MPKISKTPEMSDDLRSHDWDSISPANGGGHGFIKKRIKVRKRDQLERMKQSGFKGR